MATVTGTRPWFNAKLANVLADLSDYEAADISASPTEAQVQAIADALETLITELKAIA